MMGLMNGMIMDESMYYIMIIGYGINQLFVNGMQSILYQLNNIMSKSFRSNLRPWLVRVYNNTKKLQRSLPSSESSSESKTIDDTLADQLFHTLDEIRSSQGGLEEGMKAVENFLLLHNLQANEKLLASISQQLDRFLNAIFPPPKNCEDFVNNIWNEQTQIYECICPRTTRDLRVTEQTESCYRCGRGCHVNCLWGRQSKEQRYECPLCFLKCCLPHKKVHQILFAGFLRQIKKDKIEYKINLPQIESFAENYHLQVRCVRLSKEDKNELNWPANCAVHFNNKKIADFKPLNINSSIKKRADDEIILQKRLMGAYNTLVIEERHQYMEGYRPTIYQNHLVAVMVVQTVNLNDIVNMTLSQPHLQIYESKDILRDFMDRGMQDCFIDRYKVPLKCQFFNGPITIPVRTVHCSSHYQPFDLKGFLIANFNIKSSNQRWKCPICRRRAYHLQVDDYLLKFIRGKPNLGEIDFNNQGEPFLIEMNEELAEDEEEHKLPLENKKDTEDKVQIAVQKVVENENQNAKENQNGKENQNENASEGNGDAMDGKAVSKGNSSEPQIIIEGEQLQSIQSSRKKEYIEIIELEDEDNQLYHLPMRAKRTYNERKNQFRINPQPEGQPKKRKKRGAPKANKEVAFVAPPKSILQVEKIISQEEISSESISSNNQSQFTPDVYRNKKQKIDRRRKRNNQIEDTISKEVDKKTKTLVPSPAITTVIPQAFRLLDKKIPQPPKKPPTPTPQSIDIQSSDQDQPLLKQLKIRSIKQQLQRQKTFLYQRLSKSPISSSDDAIFMQLCEKFMYASIKSC